MIKRIIAAASALLILMSLSACSVRKDDVSDSISTAATTVKETRIHNNFKDALPDFEFDNPVSEDYQESIKYVFNVECSEKECEKYIKELKNAGFLNNAIETDSYYTASTEEGYFVEMTYINGTLTVYTKKTA